MAIVGAVAVPHPPVIVPAVGRGRESALGQTDGAYRQAARCVARWHPDTLVVISPHAPGRADGVQISPGEAARGDLAAFGAPEEGIENIKEENIEYLEKGIHNLLKHIDNLKNIYGLNVIVGINKYITDTDKEIEYLRKKLEEQGVEISLVEAWEKGGKGAIDLANKIVKLCKQPSEYNYCYDLKDGIKEKIEKVATKVYGATGVEYSKQAEETIKKLEKDGYANYPVCIAKTQYSLSDDAKNLLCNDPFKIHVKDVILKNGAEFIVILTGNIFTMPGLPKVPAAEKIDLNAKGEIVGIF